MVHLVVLLEVGRGEKLVGLELLQEGLILEESQERPTLLLKAAIVESLAEPSLCCDVSFGGGNLFAGINL